MLTSVAVLVSILTAAFFLSILLTVLTLASFIFFRLALLFSKEGRSGVAVWADELKRHLLRAIKGNEQKGQTLAVQEDIHSDSTNDSGVLIQSEKPVFEDATF